MASRACGNRLSLRNQYDTKTPRASTFSQGFPPAPAQFDSTGRTELASRKNLQRGFRVDPNFVRVTPKMSVENFLEPGNRKNLPGLPNQCDGRLDGLDGLHDLCTARVRISGRRDACSG